MKFLIEFSLAFILVGVTCDVTAAWLLERDPEVN